MRKKFTTHWCNPLLDPEYPPLPLYHQQVVILLSDKATLHLSPCQPFFPYLFTQRLGNPLAHGSGGCSLRPPSHIMASKAMSLVKVFRDDLCVQFFNISISLFECLSGWTAWTWKWKLWVYWERNSEESYGFSGQIHSHKQPNESRPRSQQYWRRVLAPEQIHQAWMNNLWSCEWT